MDYKQANKNKALGAPEAEATHDMSIIGVTSMARHNIKIAPLFMLLPWKQ
jgi:hypothetical protein